MTTIERQPLGNAASLTSLWAGVAERSIAWCRCHDVVLRDAVLLLPYAQLVPLARHAFAQRGGLLPRIETTLTLAAALGPPPLFEAGQISFDAVLDALSARSLLSSRNWGAGWARRDPRGFERAVATLTDSAQALARAAAALPPGERSAHWVRARSMLSAAAGPGASERLLARIAIEWASFSPPPSTDRLFAARTAAWIAIEAGGADRLVSALMAAAIVPCLVIDADPREGLALTEAALAECVPVSPPTSAPCDDFEHEAQCAAAQVLDHVRRGERPVALIAQDRLLVRRVRALLARQEVRLVDETGWTLSTTRAAAQVMTLIRAARADAGIDALFDWLKSIGVDAGALETECRRQRITCVAALNETPLSAVAERQKARSANLLGLFTGATRRPLRDWLAALAGALEASGAAADLEADDAGRQVLAALRLGPQAISRRAWPDRVASVSMTAPEFEAWVDRSFEAATFRPTPRSRTPADVVVTPLARAALRPFAAVVFPGLDDRRFGTMPAPHPLFDERQAEALGLATVEDRRLDEWLAFLLVLRSPKLTLLRRHADGREPLAMSPWLARLDAALVSRGRALSAWRDPRRTIAFAAAPIEMSSPAAPGLLPQRLSASAYEAMRACPYRFFALNMLRLTEDDELEREPDKRDYGNWVHAVLYDFHRERTGPADAETEIARLQALAAEKRAAQASTEAAFLPYLASFDSFAPRYVEWLHRRDAEGIRWRDAERELTLESPALGETRLRGVIDRIDERGAGGDAEIELIDYKTGGADRLAERVRQPLEDTQLAFYAALMRSSTDRPITARYVALDSGKKIKELVHQDVEASAVALLEGLSHDLRRLRDGAGLPALGEGSACDHCAARGICRRDHWIASPPAARTV